MSGVVEGRGGARRLPRPSAVLRPCESRQGRLPGVDDEGGQVEQARPKLDANLGTVALREAFTVFRTLGSATPLRRTAGPHRVFSSRRTAARLLGTNIWLVRTVLAAIGFLVGVGAGLVLVGGVLNVVVGCFSEGITGGCVVGFPMLGLVLAAIVFAVLGQRRGALWAGTGLIGLVLGGLGGAFAVFIALAGGG